MKKHLVRACVVSIVLVGIASLSRADEGMWLFNNPPKELLKKKYNFEPTKDWLEHVQKSSVRFNSGGSGSFVSADGLVMTNHHVGADCLQKLGDKDHNYYRDGFYAKTRDEEKKCPDVELNVLISIEDVTDRVTAAVKPDMKPGEAAVARRTVMAEIEKESLEKTGLRSDVVTLFQGGQYHLYRFKKYTDVRVVFAPEQQIAFYGGDPDNFEYPRFDLDICFVRVYENDKPAKIEHYLKWSKAGADKDELVFVSGHPGRTNRSYTMAHLEYLRDYDYPYMLQRLNRLEVILTAWSAREEENARKAKEFLFSMQNSRKAREGGFAGLLDPKLMTKKMQAEKELRRKVEEDPKWKHVAGAWDKIAESKKVMAKNLKTYAVLEGRSAFTSDLFGIARTLVRVAEEDQKKDGERLREYRSSNRESLKQNLFTEEPIYDDYEQFKLANSLTWMVEQLGSEHELVVKVLNGKSPRERAAELIKGTKLKDVAQRKKLYEGKKDAIDASDDPMIALAKLVDADARAVRKIVETQVEEVDRQAYAQIDKARYALQGADMYPDATFTLRLSIGVVKGYEEDGKPIPHQTTFAGLYERAKEHKNKPPFDLPQRWVERKDKLDLTVPYNFVHTNDIIGGNSGSPVVNKEAEVVGIIFDGNIQSLVLNTIYSEDQARAVSVHSQGIIEALRKVYDANGLADELTGKKE